MNNQNKRFKVAGTHATAEMILGLYEIMWICYYLESVRSTIEKDSNAFICRELLSLKGVDKQLIDLATEYVAASMNHSSSKTVFTVDMWLDENGYDWDSFEEHRVRKDFLNNMIVELTRVLKENQYPF